MKEQPLIDRAQEKILPLEAETRFAQNGIVNRTVSHAPASRTVSFEFAKRQELTEPTATQHALFQVLSVCMLRNLAPAVKATIQAFIFFTLSKTQRHFSL